MVGMIPAKVRRCHGPGRLQAIKPLIGSFRLYRREDLESFLRSLRAPAAAGP